MLGRLALALLLLLNGGSGIAALGPQVRAHRDDSSTPDIQNAADISPISVATDLSDDGIDAFVLTHAINALAGFGLAAGLLAAAPLAVEHARAGWVLGQGCQSNC